VNFHQTEKLYLKQNCLEALISELKLISKCQDQESFDRGMKTKAMANNYLVILQLIVQDHDHETVLNACVTK
jgi:hypothetical protein